MLLKKNFKKLFKKHSLLMQTTPDDGLGNIQNRPEQFW